jgi:hypothetical protein
MLSNNDKAAIASLLARFVESWNLRAHDQKQASEIAARIITHNKKLQNLETALEVYDFARGDKEMWDKVKNVIGEEAYDQAIRAGTAAAVKGGAVIEEEEEEEEKPEEAVTETVLFDSPAAAGAARPTVRNALSNRLEAIAPKGAKAADLRAFLESTYGMKLHEKTVGMTLYRLARDHQVRREGRTWFFVPSKAGTKNPGAATPGPIESLL